MRGMTWNIPDRCAVARAMVWMQRMAEVGRDDVNPEQ
jgi:hypothetical protein